MIYPKEIRIGNYVNFLGKPKKLIGLSKRNYNMNTETTHHYAEFENHIPVMFSHLKPIPITEEILLKCGFVRKEKRLGKYIKEDYLFYRGFKIQFHEKVKVRYKDLLLFEKDLYLHQLQNLFYSLTGKELNIEL